MQEDMSGHAEWVESLKQEAREELQRLKTKYDVWPRPFVVRYLLDTTAADFIHWVQHHTTEMRLPNYPQDTEIAPYGDLGLEGYECHSLHGNAWVWRCLPFLREPQQEIGQGVTVSSVVIDACNLAPVRCEVTLILHGYHLGGFFDTLQTAILARWPNSQLPEVAGDAGPGDQATQEAKARMLPPDVRERHKRLKELWQQGYSQEDAAKDLQISVSTVKRDSQELDLTWK